MRIRGTGKAPKIQLKMASSLFLSSGIRCAIYSQLTGDACRSSTLPQDGRVRPVARIGQPTPPQPLVGAHRDVCGGLRGICGKHGDIDARGRLEQLLARGHRRHRVHAEHGTPARAAHLQRAVHDVAAEQRRLAAGAKLDGPWPTLCPGVGRRRRPSSIPRPTGPTRRASAGASRSSHAGNKACGSKPNPVSSMRMMVAAPS